MKYRDDIDAVEDMAVMILREAKEKGLNYSQKQFSDVIEIVRNTYYTAQDSFRKKSATTNSILQAFIIGIKN